MQIIDTMKAGAQKAVFVVHDGHTEHVMKVQGISYPDVHAVLERARREVALLHQIDSPHVVRIETPLVELTDGTYSTDVIGVAWLEEHLDGQDFAALTGTLWPISDVQQLLEQVGSGLSALHNVRVVHRDLSPGNVRLTSAGCWKVLDPGYARHMDASTITAFGQPGTPGFYSPEHVSPLAKPVRASDIFTLGILAYVALSGALPFPTHPQDEYYRLLSETQAPDVRSLRPDVPESLAEVLNRMLARQPARRYLAGSELLDALGGLR